MSQTEEGTAPTESAVLTGEEATAIVEGTEPEEAVLPSDTTKFEVPEKFEGKSIEDVIKSYQELEKLQSKGGDEISQEEAPATEVEETKASPEEDTVKEYMQKFEDQGKLTEADYKDLADKGYNKEAVDGAVSEYSEQKEFKEYKANKQLESVLEPLGGGAEKFKEVATWANKNKPAEEVKAFNEALASSSKLAQQALLKQLYTEYNDAGQAQADVLHTNQSQSRPHQGYKTQEEFFKDIGSPEYTNNAAYRKAVEDKMSKSDIF